MKSASVTMSSEEIGPKGGIISSDQKVMKSASSSMSSNKIGSPVCHRIYARKRSFNNLAKELNQPFKSLDEMPTFQQNKLKHGIKFEPVARDKYCNVMKHYLKRPITLRETGMVIPPCMFWLEGSPDALVIDPCASYGKTGTIELKCPEGKKNHTPQEAKEDELFHIALVHGKPNLKEDTTPGYYFL